MRQLSTKEHRMLDMLARTGEIDWSCVHANTVNALKRKGLVDGRSVTSVGQTALAAVPNIFDDLFAQKEAAMPKTRQESNDAFRPIEHIDTTLHDTVRDHWDEGSDQGGVRLYRTASPLTHGKENARWSLQVRARVKTKTSGPGKHFAIGTASMSREDLEWLRDQINAELRRKT
jgi:hypothetical protein